MVEKRLTSDQKRDLTLRGLFEFEGSQKEGVLSETKRFIKDLEGIVDPVSGQNVLDMKVRDMDVGQVIGDVIEKSEFGIKDAKNNPDTRARSQGLIIRLKTMFGGAGYSTDHVNKKVKNYLGEDAYEANTKMSLFRKRKTALGFPDDVYPKLKGVLQDPTLPQDAKLQLAAHLFGGYRPATLSTFDIKNFDAKKGIVSVYDAKSKTTKVTVLNPVLVDIFKQASKGRTTGPIFFDIKKNSELINDKLKASIGEVSFLKPSGNIEKEAFSIYKLRNMNETLLEESGLGKEDRAFLSGRAQATEAAGYVSQKSRKRRVDQAGRELIAKIIGYSGDSSPAQFGEDTGLKFSDTSKKIPILSSLLQDEDYVKTLPEGFVESLPGEGNFLTDKAAESDPELAEQRRRQALEESRKGEATAGLAADELERKRQELLLSQPELTEQEAERLARERLTKQQASKKVKTQQDIDQLIADDVPPDQRDSTKSESALEEKARRRAARLNALKTTLKGVGLGVATVAEEALGRIALPIEVRGSAQLSTQMSDLMQQRSKLDPDDPKYAALTEQIGQKESSLKDSLVDTATLGLAPAARALGKQEVQRSDELRKVFGIPQSKQQSNNTDEQVNNLLQQP